MQSQYRQLNANAMRTISAFCSSGFMRPIYWVPYFLFNLLQITKIPSRLGSEFKSRNLCSHYKHNAVCAFSKKKEFCSLRILARPSSVQRKIPKEVRLPDSWGESRVGQLMIPGFDNDTPPTLNSVHPSSGMYSFIIPNRLRGGAFIAKLNEQLNLHEKRFTKNAK